MRFSRACFTAGRAANPRPPLVSIKNATFYRTQPVGADAATSQAIFPGLDFAIASDKDAGEHWAVVGPSNSGKTTFLEMLQGQLLCFPPTARSYPHLSTEEVLSRDRRLGHPARALQHVSFSAKQKGLAGMGSYLSARYESRREATDFSVLDFLQGNTQLNAAEAEEDALDHDLLARVIRDLRLEKLAEMPVSNLSNGQSRRARIAKALLGKPEMLLLDEPFMGLDPPTTVKMNPLLRNLAASCAPRLMLSLRTQDPIPDWITHLVYLGENLRVTHMGAKDEVIKQVLDQANALRGSTEEVPALPYLLPELGYVLTDLGIAHPKRTADKPSWSFYTKSMARFEDGDRSDITLKQIGMGCALGNPNYNYEPAVYARKEWAPPKGDAVVEMRGVRVKYGAVTALGDWDSQQSVQGDLRHAPLTVTPLETDAKADEDAGGLWWTVRRGDRWVVCGPNGSGKTTLLSLLLSDHPQAYSQPVRVFGRSRLPSAGQPGISVFDIQRRIGHSSPEVQAFFPKSLSLRAVLESAYADTPAGRPTMTSDDDLRVSACLRWFQGELNPALGMDQNLLAEMNRRGSVIGVPYRVDVGGSKEDYNERKRRFWYDYEQRQEANVAWADNVTFGELTYSAQRVALFLRAMVAQPDIIVLDEAFGGMDELVRDKCMLFLEYGESRALSAFDRKHDYTINKRGLSTRQRTKQDKRHNIAIPTGLTAQQALICVSHVQAEVPPPVEQWIYLPEAGSDETCRLGSLKRPLRDDAQLWGTIWGMKRTPGRSIGGGYGMYYDFDGSKSRFDAQEAEHFRQSLEIRFRRPVSAEEYQERLARTVARRLELGNYGRWLGKEKKEKPFIKPEDRRSHRPLRRRPRYSKPRYVGGFKPEDYMRTRRSFVSPRLPSSSSTPTTAVATAADNSGPSPAKEEQPKLKRNGRPRKRKQVDSNRLPEALEDWARRHSSRARQAAGAANVAAESPAEKSAAQEAGSDAK